MLRRAATTILPLVMIALTAVLAPGADRAGGLPQTERIAPEGIPGALLLTGQATPAAACARFVELAGGKQARVVVLIAGEQEMSDPLVGRLMSHWQQRQAASFQLLRLRSKEAMDEGAVSSLAQASGLWLLGDPPLMSQLLADSPLARECLALRERGGVVGAAGALAVLCGAQNGDGPCHAWLPDSMIECSTVEEDAETSLARLLETNPGLVGYDLADDAAICVRGRDIQPLGDGVVTIHLAASETRPADQWRLSRGQVSNPSNLYPHRADLTALRHAARDRAGTLFPAQPPNAPRLKSGTLMIIGGGGMPRGIVERFVKAAGGAEAAIVMLPTANPDPVPLELDLAESFRRAGAKKVTILPSRRLEDVEGEEYQAALRTATGIWFGGGRQWRFVDAYLGTEALPLMHDVLARGGAIMGSSAGASIQAEYLARGNPLGNLDIMAEGYERGLGFLPGVAIDQHFAQRQRFRDMTSLVARYPQLLGIGVDESTALVVEGSVGEVVGRGSVHFYDAGREANDGQADHESVAAGGRYDLVERRVLEASPTTE